MLKGSIRSDSVPLRSKAKTMPEDKTEAWRRAHTYPAPGFLGCGCRQRTRKPRRGSLGAWDSALSAVDADGSMSLDPDWTRLPDIGRTWGRLSMVPPMGGSDNPPLLEGTRATPWGQVIFLVRSHGTHPAGFVLSLIPAPARRHSRLAQDCLPNGRRSKADTAAARPRVWQNE